MKFLSYNSPLGQIGTKLFDLIWLQILFLLTCLPVFTIGAACTAMHNMLLKLYRNEEISVSGQFFKAFRENFKQATLIWLLYLLCFFILISDYLVSAQIPDTGLKVVLQLLPIPLVVLVVTLTWVFVLQSRYQNTIRQTLKNSLLLCISRPFTSIGMIALSALPFVLAVFIPSVIPVVLILGITLPGYLSAVLYSRVFDKLEGTDWRKQAAKELAESMQE